MRPLHACVLVIALIGVGVAGVQAATLGGVTAKSLGAFEQPGSTSAPTVVGCDSFTGTTGASMSLRAVTTAGPCSSLVWTVHVGTWTIQTSQGASSATASAVATLNTSFIAGSAEVVLASLNTGGRSGGLVLSHDGVSTYLAAVMIDATPDRIELRIVNGGVSTLLGTANPTFLTTNTLRLTRSGSSMTVLLNATSVLTFSLSAAQVSSLGTGGRAGLFGGNGSVRFDNFVATNP